MSRGLLILIIGVAVLAGLSVFTVDERERAIKFELGRIKRADYAPGLHFKIPIFQNVKKFDARIQNLDADPELYLTVQKKNLKVDSFVKWRVAKVEDFYTATGGSFRIASERLLTIIRKGLKDEFGKRTVQQVVSGERTEIMDILTKAAQRQASDLGVEVLDVRIKRIDLPEEVSSSVYQRMAAERQRISKDLRARGEEEAKKIRADANRRRAILLAEAERDAQRIRGEGDGHAAEVYAQAFQQDPEFYRLYRSLNAYKATFTDRADILLLQPDAEFFRYFKSPTGEP